MSKQLTAVFRVVTPLFLGGSDPVEVAELRVPSLKGALRFWWRALMWGKVTNIHELRQREAQLFGSSQEGQSKVFLCLEATQSISPLRRGALLARTGERAASPKEAVVEDGARYLGYGLMDAFTGKNTQEGRLTRPCLPAPFEFKLHIRFAPDITSEQQNEFIAALTVFGLCGGLGSRSRRGFGSVTLTSLTGEGVDRWAPPANAQEWEQALYKTCSDFLQKGDLPGWTSFAKGTSKVLLLSSSPTSPLQLLARIGRDFVFYRSAGRRNPQTKKREVFGREAELNFKEDHDLMDNVINRHIRPSTHPSRIAFGLPQNYFFSSNTNKGSVTPASYDRRASSLLFHIHQSAPDHPPLGVLVFLPARFLPVGKEEISVNNSKVSLAHNGTGEFWKPVQDFLERLHAHASEKGFSHSQLLHL